MVWGTAIALVVLFRLVRVITGGESDDIVQDGLPISVLDSSRSGQGVLNPACRDSSCGRVIIIIPLADS